VNSDKDVKNLSKERLGYPWIGLDWIGLELSGLDREGIVWAYIKGMFGIVFKELKSTFNIQNARLKKK
jgi:hypothetical protein